MQKFSELQNMFAFEIPSFMKTTLNILKIVPISSCSQNHLRYVRIKVFDLLENFVYYLKMSSRNVTSYIARCIRLIFEILVLFIAHEILC